MKATNILCLGIAALSLAACGNDDVTVNNGDNKVAAQFSANIEKMDSRAADTSWDANDKIGISVVSGEQSYTNVCYTTTDGDGKFENKETPIYYQGDGEVEFTAYYPWNTQGTFGNVDTRNQSRQKDFDFLWATAKGSKGTNDGKVSFTFAHKMTKVVFTIKKGNGVSYDEVKAAKLYLDGFIPTGSFDVANGTATASGQTGGKWQFFGSETTYHNVAATLDDTEETATYSLIFFPQAFHNNVSLYASPTEGMEFSAGLDFTEVNQEKDTDTAKNAWVAGRQYNVGIVLNKTNLSVEGCTIKDWDNVGGSKDVEATMQQQP